MLHACLAVAVSCSAHPTPPVTPDQIEQIVEVMTLEGVSFDAAELLDGGVPALQALLDYVLPIPGPSDAATRSRMAAIVELLGDDSYLRREKASATLFAEARGCGDVVRIAAATHDDLEIRYRAGEIVRRWEALDGRDRGPERRFASALNAYFSKLRDTPSHETLARHIVLALTARLDETPRREALALALGAVARSNEDSVHDVLVVLLDHHDPAVPMFAMKRIAGRTGNSYVAPIHIAALDSGRRELVKCALKSMPCPIWDPRAKPPVQAALEKVLDGATDEWNFDDDPRFVELCAFVAARDFGVERATRYLLDSAAGPDLAAARRAVLALGDTYYRRRPITADLLDAIAPHLDSKDVDLRYAAVYTLGVYTGAEVLSHLVTGLGDDAEQVWKEAGRRLVDQHAFYEGDGNPVVVLLRETRGHIPTPTHRQRIDRILVHLEKTPNGAFRW